MHIFFCFLYPCSVCRAGHLRQLLPCLLSWSLTGAEVTQAITHASHIRSCHGAGWHGTGAGWQIYLCDPVCPGQGSQACGSRICLPWSDAAVLCTVQGWPHRERVYQVAGVSSSGLKKLLLVNIIIKPDWFRGIKASCGFGDPSRGRCHLTAPPASGTANDGNNSLLRARKAAHPWGEKPWRNTGKGMQGKLGETWRNHCNSWCFPHRQCCWNQVTKSPANFQMQRHHVLIYRGCSACDLTSKVVIFFSLKSHIFGEFHMTRTADDILLFSTCTHANCWT